MARKSKHTFKVKKASGDYERFSRIKLAKSLQRCGLPRSQCQSIADRIKGHLHEGISTKEIFQKTLPLIKEQSHRAAAHYSLKSAILALGPSGFYFEKFIGKLFSELGYTTIVGRTLKGKCVDHEVDIIASSGEKTLLVECKFHNHQGKKNDIKTALYVKARRDDLQEAPHGFLFHEYWLVSNTGFTKDAIQYAVCSNLNLLGLNFPEMNPLPEQIKKLKLYPITSLRRLRRHVLDSLLERNIILCRELPLKISLLKSLGMKDHEINLLLSDVADLLGDE